MTDEVAASFDECERIGVVSSPSSTNLLTIDILGTAVDKKLVESLCAFKYIQDTSDHYALGQVSEVRLRNLWVEDATMRGLIRQKGRVDPVTEKQDTHNATIYLSSVFTKKNKVEGSIFGTVPPTGTSVRLANEMLLRQLLADYKSDLFYLGKAYGTDILLPLWFKHFGSGPGGAGEAYHIGIFGKTGSGKSVLARMILTGYSKNRNMSVIVLDSQGEFSKLKNDLKLNSILKEHYNRTIEIYDLSSIVLTDSENFELFAAILTSSSFLDRLAIYHEDNKARAMNQIIRVLRNRPRTLTNAGTDGVTKPWELVRRDVFDSVWTALGTAQVQANIYTGTEPRARMAQEYQAADQGEFFRLWANIARLFTEEGKTKPVRIKEFVAKVTKPDEGSIVVIDLSETDVPANLYWNQQIKLIVIERVLERLKTNAEERFKQNQQLNTLVIIDEAHRLAPREKTENMELEAVRSSLVDGALTTRKYGLGWMFISQTLSSLDSDILGQLRIYIFGFGLGWGIELRALRDLIGGKDEAIGLYQMFKDPQSVLGEKEYSFMTVGPASPLSFSGSPLFFTALRYPDDFFKANFGDKLGSERKRAT